MFLDERDLDASWPKMSTGNTPGRVLFRFVDYPKSNSYNTGNIFFQKQLLWKNRSDSRKRRKIEKSWPASDTSEESLFKGWVGIPRDVVRKKKPGVISR